MQELYFHADAEGRVYRATIEIQGDSPGELVIDRIELRDMLAGVVLNAFKTSRNLLRNDAVTRMAEQGKSDKTLRYRHRVPAAPLTPEERAARDRDLAARVPPLNSLSTQDFPKHYQLPRDFQQFLGGAHWRSAAEEYLLNGAPVIEAALTDADGDGKQGLAFYDFGVDDTVEIPVRVGVRRLPDGRHAVSANAPCVVGKTDITPADLAQGPVTIDLPRLTR